MYHVSLDFKGVLKKAFGNSTARYFFSFFWIGYPGRAEMFYTELTSSCNHGNMG